MKCHWCDKETYNHPDGEHLDTNGNLVTLCDLCQKSSDEGIITLSRRDIVIKLKRHQRDIFLVSK